MAEATNSVPGDLDPAAEYTHEVLVQLRKLGVAKPDFIPAERWEAAVEVRQRSELQTRIAEMLSMPISQGDKGIYGVLLPQAITEAARILEDPDEPARTKIALIQWIGDQFSGKASQQVEHTGSVALELRKAAAELESRQVSGLLQKATAAEVVDAAVVAVDSFLESKVGEDFSVGKRGKLGEEPEPQPGEGLHERTRASVEPEGAEG